MFILLVVGLIMGTRLWYAMWDAENDDDAAFERRVERVVREIGERGKIKPHVAEDVPPKAAAAATATVAAAAPPASASFEPTPEPAPERATPSNDSRAAPTRAPMPEQHGFSPSVQHNQMLSPSIPMHSSVESSALLERLLARQQDMMERQSKEMQSKLEQQRKESETKMEQQRKESEAKMNTIHVKMETMQEELAAPPRAVIAKEQLHSLQTRLEGLHTAKLLSDEELGAIEDSLADFLEASAGCELVTMEMVNMNRAVGTVLKLIALSEGMAKDNMFARQLKRKFC